MCSVAFFSKNISMLSNAYEAKLTQYLGFMQVYHLTFGLVIWHITYQYYSANTKCSFSHSHKKNVLVIVFVCIQYKYLIGSSSPSSKSNVPGHWLFFCPAPKVGPYFGRRITKSLDFPKWHWLILALMGANVYVHQEYKSEIKNWI